MDATGLLFDGFPLVGLIGLRPADDDSLGVQWTAVLRKLATLPDGTMQLVKVEVELPPLVIREMQGGDPAAPICRIYAHESNPWARVQAELNTAAERAAARFV